MESSARPPDPDSVAQPAGSAVAPALACLTGGRPDPQILQDWAVYQSIGHRAREALLELLQRVYRLPLGAELAQHVGGFAQQAGLEPMQAQNALDVCRFVFSHAAGSGISTAQLQQDLEALRPGQRAGIDQLLLHFERFGPIRRQEALRDALLDHGKLLTGVDWRLDRSQCSNRAARIDTPVVVLTFNYREGSGERGRSDALSLQIPAVELGSLRAILERIEGALARNLEREGG